MEMNTVGLMLAPILFNRITAMVLIEEEKGTSQCISVTNCWCWWVTKVPAIIIRGRQQHTSKTHINNA